MKVYAVEYDFDLYTVNSCCEPVSTERRTETFKDVTEFINRVKTLSTDKVSYLSGNKDYIRNLKTYSGELKEIDINKVINPF